MHQIFQTDEILRIIIAHLANPLRCSVPLTYSSSQYSASGTQVVHAAHLAANSGNINSIRYGNEYASSSFVSSLGINERKALARAARTCHAWSEIALDALWREIPTVEPLFGLFPPSCISGINRHESLVSVSFDLKALDLTSLRLQAVHKTPRAQRLETVFILCSSSP